jgi:septal ring factor EnvC (AmiA/AmiB activator)
MEESSGGPPATPPGAEPSGSRADPHERIDGLRRWINQLDGGLKVRTYAGAILAALALAAGGAALGITLSRDEGPSEAEVQRLQNEIAALQAESSTSGSELEENLDAVAKAVDQLIGKIENFEGDRQQFNSDLSEIRSDIRQLRQQGQQGP